MQNANNGYVGYSMSVRASEAYDMGEMPKSKWTKQNMLAAIAEWCETEGVEDCRLDVIGKMTKDEMFGRFFYRSSWHHTSKMFNATDFYSLDEDEIEEFCNRPTIRLYHVTYHLGRSSVMHDETFATKAKAERYLERMGFKSFEYCRRRGNFSASIGYDEIEV